MIEIKRKALLAIIAGNSIFGFSFLFSKIALEMVSPSVLLAVRFTVAFIVLNLIVVFGKVIKKQDGTSLIDFSLRGKPLKYIILLAIFQPILYFMAESIGIKLTSSAFAGTIIAVIPLMGVVFDVLIMHVKVSKKQTICAAASVAGVAVTTLGAKDMESSIAGLAILMIAVVAGALFYVFSKKSGALYNPLERTYVMFAMGSAVYLIAAVIESNNSYGRLFGEVFASGEFWICIAYLGVVSSVVAFMLLNFASVHVSVSQASLFANLTTVISIIAGVIILKESFSAYQIIGAIIIIGSVYVAGREPQRTSTKEEEKNALRKEILKTRRLLSSEDVKELSKAVTNKVANSEAFKSAKNICVYMPINNEVDTEYIVDLLRSEGKRAWLPKVIKGTMDFYEYNQDTKLIDGAFNIKEPDTDKKLIADKYTLVLMPGAVFSQKRDRIGYGGGYYDRYLSKNSCCTTMAICYDFQILNKIPTENHDIRPDVIVSDKRIIK